MKKWYRYLAAGVLVLLTLCVAGCGGVSHKSPEKVTEELIQSYTDGKEKKVKECYNQADNTEADRVLHCPVVYSINVPELCHIVSAHIRKFLLSSQSIQLLILLISCP